MPSSHVEEADNSNSIPSLNLSLNSGFEHGAAALETFKETEETVMGSSGFKTMVHGFFPPYVPVPYPFWPPNPAPPDEEKGIEASQHHSFASQGTYQCR
ncbi:hypothetical protein CRYUN_Cryun32bG0088900 [Craigia yunnanensis]